MLRQLLAAVLVVVVVGGTAAEVCSGWSAKASGRAACCARMADVCTSVSADDCCAEAEQRQNRQLTPATPQPERDMAVGALIAPFIAVADPRIARNGLSDRPRAHLLNSVFLI